MNNPFMLEQAEIFAARFKDLDEETRVTKMMTTALQREPVAQEIKGLISFVHALETKEPVPAREPVKPSQWTYGYGEVDKSSGKLKSFTHFPYYKKDAAWQGGEAWPDPGLGWLRLTPDGGHPGEGLGKVVIRRWTSPIDGSVKISGRIAHESAMGDGIHARIVHSAKGPIGGWNLHNQTIEAAIEPIEVKKGETLDFVVDCRDALSHDDFKWSPTIANLKRTSDKAGDQKQIDWVASRDFSGAQPEPPKPLDGWTALAQSLLLSNEFIFVD